MVTQDVGDTRLLELAGVLDLAQYYDQGNGSRCAYGHYRRFIRDFRSVTDEFHLTPYEAHEIFGSNGCGDARSNGKKAAQYIREFVARRNAPNYEPLKPELDIHALRPTFRELQAFMSEYVG